MDLIQWQKKMRIIGMDAAYLGCERWIYFLESQKKRIIKRQNEMIERRESEDFKQEVKMNARLVRIALERIRKKQLQQFEIQEKKREISDREQNKHMMPMGRVWNKQEKAWFLHTVKATGEHNFERLWE